LLNTKTPAAISALEPRNAFWIFPYLRTSTINTKNIVFIWRLFAPRFLNRAVEQINGRERRYIRYFGVCFIHSYLLRAAPSSQPFGVFFVTQGYYEIKDRKTNSNISYVTSCISLFNYRSVTNKVAF